MERLTLEQLLALDWDSRTLENYEHLKTRGEIWDGDGEAIAERYLRICLSIDRNPRPVRDLEIAVDPFAGERSGRSPLPLQALAASLKANKRSDEYRQAIESYLLALLHPKQIPLHWRDIEFDLYKSGFEIAGRNSIRNWLDRLEDKGLIRKIANPYRGNQFLYCNSDFRESPQVGDRVIELIRRRGSRIGTVKRFRRYRDGNRYPVVLWEFSVKTQKPLSIQFESFANPDSLVVIERPENQITRRTAS